MSAGSKQLLAGREAIAELIGRAQLDLAAAQARALRDARPDDAETVADAALVTWLRDTALEADRPLAWRAAFRMSAAHARSGSAPIASAVRAFLARGLVEATELRDGKGAVVEGEPVGVALLEAQLPSEAAASLFATLARDPRSARAALLLGNALYRLDQLADARDHYRRALRVGPTEVALEEIEDEEVRELASFAPALGIEEDVRPWLPAIGFLEDVLPLSAVDPVPGAGFGLGSQIYDLLIAHHGARSPDERQAVRRDLEALAPLFVKALREARKLDVSAPVGSA